MEAAIINRRNLLKAISALGGPTCGFVINLTTAKTLGPRSAADTARAFRRGNRV